MLTIPRSLKNLHNLFSQISVATFNFAFSFVVFTVKCKSKKKIIKNKNDTKLSRGKFK